ncbi:MAG: acyltransferase family protein [Phycisphaerae bacterium]
MVYSLDRKHLPRVLFGFIVFSILVRIVMEHFGYPVFYFTLCRLDALGMGALLAVWFPDPAGMRRYVKPATVGFLATVAVGAPLYVLLSGRHLPAVQDTKFTVIAFLYMCALVVIVGSPASSPVQRLFTSRLLRWFGGISYGMYVFHPFVFQTVGWGLSRLAGESRYTGVSWLFLVDLASSFGLTFLVAFLSWKMYEQPILRAKRRFPADGGRA